MSRVYDSWGRLVGAVLSREKLRQLALFESFDSSISDDSSFDSSFYEDEFATRASSEVISPIEAEWKSRNPVVPDNASQIEAEWIEQYEPGVYITLVALRDGTRYLKRVRFSRKRFGKHQMESWWSENRERVYDKYNVRGPNGSEPNGTHRTGANGESNSRLDAHSGIDSNTPNRMQSLSESLGDASGSNKRSSLDNRMIPNGGANVPENLDTKESVSSYRDDKTGLKSRNPVVPDNASQIEAECIEQYEPGVYITLVALRDGTRDLKRVRFSRRRFGEHQVESWWSENRERVYDKYNVRGADKSVTGHTARRSEGALSPSSQVLRA